MLKQATQGAPLETILDTDSLLDLARTQLYHAWHETITEEAKRYMADAMIATNIAGAAQTVVSSNMKNGAPIANRAFYSGTSENPSIQDQILHAVSTGDACEFAKKAHRIEIKARQMAADGAVISSDALSTLTASQAVDFVRAYSEAILKKGEQEKLTKDDVKAVKDTVSVFRAAHDPKGQVTIIDTDLQQALSAAEKSVSKAVTAALSG